MRNGQELVRAASASQETAGAGKWRSNAGGVAADYWVLGNGGELVGDVFIDSFHKRDERCFLMVGVEIADGYDGMNVGDDYAFFNLLEYIRSLWNWQDLIYPELDIPELPEVD